MRDDAQPPSPLSSTTKMYDTPFSKSSEFVHDLDIDETGHSSINHLPAFPNIPLNYGKHLFDFLSDDLLARDLETMAPRLWIMTTPSSTNINALHRQRVKGREIIMTEDPRLHLIWIHNRIFIKPLPRYLLSHECWRILFDPHTCRIRSHHRQLRAAALGFLRTYRHLIRSAADFRLAQHDSLQLVPPETTWEAFSIFISEIESNVDDSYVSPRYLYGEIRLTRLNFYAPFLLHKFYYEQVHGQYAAYFQRLYGPILFIFAILSTVLNSMQVQLAVSENGEKEKGWESLYPFFRAFSLMCMVASALISLWIVCLWLWIFTDEWIWTMGERRRQRKRVSKSLPQ
jgi:hypothetical protein